MRRALFLAAALAVCAVSSAQADWGGFYRSSTPAAPRSQPPSLPASLPDRTGMHPRTSRPQRLATPAPFDAAPFDAAPFDAAPFGTALTASGSAGDPEGLCLAEILRAQERYNIPGNLLLGIGLQEAGVSRGGQLTVWPWAVNAAGEGRLFENRAEAMIWVRERQASGVDSIDVGCLQINLRWHPGAFTSLEQGFDPRANIDYAARFLAGLYAETGDWMQAAGAYHSRTPDRAEIYLTSLRRNVAVANDRIDVLRALAGTTPAQRLYPETQQAAVPESPPAAPWEHGLWATGSQAYGLYSRERLQPILPPFQQQS